jgi:hypothetical protein
MQEVQRNIYFNSFKFGVNSIFIGQLYFIFCINS